MKRLAFTCILAALFVGCATTQPLPAPTLVAPPRYTTEELTKKILEIELTVKDAKARVRAIRALLAAADSKNVILPEKK